MMSLLLSPRSLVVLTAVLLAALLASADDVVCPSVTPSYNVTCNSTTTCCGSGTMEPQCIDPKTSQCCEWYLSAASCPTTEACCGEYGYGASSNAFCCPAHTGCCQTTGDGSSDCCDPQTDKCCRGMDSMCCPKTSICCGYSCCTTDEICVANTCRPKTPTAPPLPYSSSSPIVSWRLLWETELRRETRPSFVRIAGGVVAHALTEGWLALLSPATGRAVWNVTVGPSLQPVQLLDDTRLYAASRVLSVATGGTLWTAPPSVITCIGDDASLNVLSDGAANVVFVCLSGTRRAAAIAVLEAETGAVRHRLTESCRDECQVFRVAALRQHVLVLQQDNTFFGWSTMSGKRRWTASVPCAGRVQPLDPPRSALVYSCEGEGVGALSYKTGQKLWNAPEYTTSVVTPASSGPCGPDSDVVFLSRGHSTVVAVDVLKGGSVWASEVAIEGSVITAHRNRLFVWLLSGNRVEAIALATCTTAWSSVIGEPALSMHTGGPHSVEPYIVSLSGHMRQIGPHAQRKLPVVFDAKNSSVSVMDFAPHTVVVAVPEAASLRAFSRV